MAIANSTATRRQSPTPNNQSRSFDEPRHLDPTGMLKMRDVVRQFNLHETTIRRACDAGTLSCLTLPSGHRRFRQSDVLKWLGFDEENCRAEGSRGIPIAAVIRVSSDGQNRVKGSSDKSSLQHQEDRVREFIQNKWGGATSGAPGTTETNVTWYRSIGSGMNFERKELIQLIEDILAGKFKGGFIVATDITRICRFGIKMVEHICKLGECQIIYSMEKEDQSLNESLTDEILSILTHYTAKVSGAKTAAILTHQIDDATLRDMYVWAKQGLSYRDIGKRLIAEGRDKDPKGRSIATRSVVHKRLTQNWDALEALNLEIPPNSFELFVQACVSKKRGSTLSRKELINAYHRWAKARGLHILTDKKIRPHTKAFTKFMDSKNTTWYSDIVVCEN